MVMDKLAALAVVWGLLLPWAFIGLRVFATYGFYDRLLAGVLGGLAATVCVGLCAGDVRSIGPVLGFVYGGLCVEYSFGARWIYGRGPLVFGGLVDNARFGAGAAC